MRIRVTRKNISNRELSKALSGLIVGEGVSDAVIETLEKVKKDEPIPERYIRGIDRRMRADYDDLMSELTDNIDRWIAYQRKPKRPLMRKADDGNGPPNITQSMIDELKALIEAHFRKAIGIGWEVPKPWQKQWSAAGIVPPSSNLNQWIEMAYVAGRLSEVLSNSSTFAEMKEKAKRLPMSRIDQLAMEAAKQNAARYVVGYAERLKSMAENAMLEHNKGLMHNVIQRYFEGEIRHTSYNGEGLSPEEAKALEGEKRVNGWQELSTELKNRFKTTDAGRDWDRVARTEIRYSTNVGRLVNIQIEGGGDPDNIEIYYHVQPMACSHCKELYLHEDGTPKVFTLSHIMRNVEETGGLNVGRKASLIGEEGGWIPNAVVHPNCHCYPLRIIPGLEPVWYKAG